MNEQIVRVHTIKKIKNVLVTQFNELLRWLAIVPDSMTMQDFAKLVYDFFDSVNKIGNGIEPMKPMEPMKPTSNRINKTFQDKPTPRPGQSPDHPYSSQN